MLMHEQIEEKLLREYSPILFAYVGDAVFELAVRTRLLMQGKRRIKDMHLDAVDVVRAGSQARLLKQMLDGLSEKEQEIVRRGRNSRSTPPRNADVQDYRMSTGFEALLGYTYLKGDELRLQELLQLALEDL